MGEIDEEKIKPPSPEPPAVIPWAKLRFFQNHWLTIGTVETYKNPTPIPTMIPCVIISCQNSRANDAAIRPPEIRPDPKNIHAFVPACLVRMFTNGAVQNAARKFVPPTNE
jgi:hypothetical protein